MASSVQAAKGNHVTISTDAVVSNSCVYTENYGRRIGAIIKTLGPNAVSADLLIMPVGGNAPYFKSGVIHSIDHHVVNSWDWT